MTTATMDKVSLKVEEGIATLTLNRPDAYNALDLETVQAMADAMAAIEANDDVRVVVIRGEGRGFCAGGDLAFIGSRGSDLRGAIDDLLGAAERFLIALRNSPRLVVTSVHGSAAGAGLSLAMAGDFCIAASDATFVGGYAKLGVTPDFGGTANAVRTVGVRRAMRLFLAEDRIDAATACELGLVTKRVEPAQLEAETLAFAKRLAAIPAQAAQGTKRLLQDAATTPFEQQLVAERESFQSCVHSPATQAAIARFTQR